MISSFELKSDTMKVIAEKMQCRDTMAVALDTVAFKLASRAMMVELANDRAAKEM